MKKMPQNIKHAIISPFNLTEYADDVVIPNEKNFLIKILYLNCTKIPYHVCAFKVSLNCHKFSRV